MITKEAIDRIVELGGTQAVGRAAANGDPYAIIPSNTKIESLKHLCPPAYIERQVRLQAADSFAEYVNRFKTPATLIFAEETAQGVKLKSILDYHLANPTPSADRCLHVALYESLPTVEWAEWKSADRKPKDQVAFATWLEDNAALFRNPTGADLLELVRTLTGKNEVRFMSAIRLDSGANRLQYDEDVELKGQLSTKSGAVVLPSIVTAGIAPFQGSAAYEVNARLKYRIESRKLNLWFETIAPHIIMRDAVLGVLKLITEKTGLTPLLGTT